MVTLSPQNVPCCFVLSYSWNTCLKNESESSGLRQGFVLILWDLAENSIFNVRGHLFHIHVSGSLKRYSLISCNSNKIFDNVLKSTHPQLPLGNSSNGLWLHHLNISKAVMSLSDLYKRVPACCEAFHLVCGHLCD